MNGRTDAEWYKKFDMPPLGLSFEDSQRRRLCFRNLNFLYSCTCDATGQDIVSIYSPDKPHMVYKQDYWWSDAWDPMSYGRDFDFSRPFFEQFGELTLQVPRLALANFQAVNSEYCNMTAGNKNCYLIFGGDFNQDCMYGILGMHNRDSLDLDYSNENNYCYELEDTINSYSCQFAFDSKSCNSCYFVSNCSGCTECILCTNLAMKTYCIENKQYSKEDYLEKKKELINGSYAMQKMLFEKFLELRRRRIVKFSNQINCVDSIGDYLKNCKNCINCFDASGSEDLKNVVFASKAKDCFECSLLGDGAEFCFNSWGQLASHNVRCSCFAVESSDILYCEYIFNSQNLFGCVGLRGKKYCILNKPYSKDAYEALRERIIAHMKATGEWGQFFPPQLADFGYNESTAGDYFPLTKEEAVAQGYKWYEGGQKAPQPQTVAVPDEIQDVPETIVNEILQCEDCKKNFRVLKQEVQFYKKMLIPVPHLCSSCRYKRRTAMRNPRKLWPGKCAKCSVFFQTTYAPDRPETVYCEQCYLKEVY